MGTQSEQLCSGAEPRWASVQAEGPVSPHLFLHLRLAHSAVSTLYKQRQNRKLLKNVPTSTKIKSKCA